jgi:hypothetical protein
MEEDQHGGAGHGESAERDRQPYRQRGGRDQNRGKKQKRKRVLQAAGKKQQSGQFDDVQCQQSRGVDRLQPLHRVEGGLQHKVEHGRQADDGNTGDNRDVELEPLHHDENGGKLAKCREPAQPQDCVQTDVAARMSKIGGGNFGHIGTLAAQGHDHKLTRQALRRAGQSLALAAAMAQ